MSRAFTLARMYPRASTRWRVSRVAPSTVLIKFLAARQFAEPDGFAARVVLHLAAGHC